MGEQRTDAYSGHDLKGRPVSPRRLIPTSAPAPNAPPAPPPDRASAFTGPSFAAATTATAC